MVEVLHLVLFHDIKITPDASNSDADWRTLRSGRYEALPIPLLSGKSFVSDIA